MEAILQLLQQAEQYRRLALAIRNRRDPAVQRILERATEIEAEATAWLIVRATTGTQSRRTAGY
jgi:hypothetical protein